MNKPRFYTAWAPLPTLVSIGALGLATLMGGCASVPTADVTAQMTRTETSIAQAEQAGAQQTALQDLQLAKDKLATAQQALNKHDYEVTLRLAQQAQLDAQYAAAKAQSTQTQKAASDVEQSINTLRQEAARGGS